MLFVSSFCLLAFCGWKCGSGYQHIGDLVEIAKFYASGLKLQIMMALTIFALRFL
jgi:hypothetical protein